MIVQTSVHRIFSPSLSSVGENTAPPNCCGLDMAMWLDLSNGRWAHVLWEKEEAVSVPWSMLFGLCHCHGKNMPLIAHWFQNTRGTWSRGWPTGLQLDAKPSIPICKSQSKVGQLGWPAGCKQNNKRLLLLYAMNLGMVYYAANADWYRNLYLEMYVYVSKNLQYMELAQGNCWVKLKKRDLCYMVVKYLVKLFPVITWETENILNELVKLSE